MGNHLNKVCACSSVFVLFLFLFFQNKRSWKLKMENDIVSWQFIFESSQVK